MRKCSDILEEKMTFSNSFVHLNVHSDFSLDDSILRYSDAVAFAQEHEAPAVAITDVNNLFATVRAYKKAKAAGLKPLISSKLMVIDDVSGVSDAEARPLVVIATNNAGYKDLCYIVSEVYERGQDGATPYSKLSWLQGRTGGLVALSGGREGGLGQLLLEGSMDKARTYAEAVISVFGAKSFFIELQRVGHPQDNDHNHAALTLCQALQIPPVATNNVRFLRESDFLSHQIRVAIGKGMKLDLYERGYPHQYMPQQYLKTPSEMIELFDDIPEAVENTVRLAALCDVEIELGKNYLPRFATPGNEDEDDYLRKMSLEGLSARIKSDFNESEIDPVKYAHYYDRLDFELNVIKEMGFPGYFLIVADFIQWAKDNDVPVGPGRGSGAGSLVAYAAKITDIDPLKYDLLFERFLNPARVSMPDFDVDFCMDRRDLVIQYVSEKYGHKAVSQIVTFGTMAAKVSIRDVARALGYSFSMGGRLSNLIPEVPGITLRDAIEQSSELDLLMKEDPDVAKIMGHALALEGVTRQTGKHAGGVVIAPSALTDFTPTYSEPDGSGFVSQYDKNDVEDAGLVKFDFLGLRTLTITHNAVKNIHARHDEKFDLLSIPLDDEAVFDMFTAGDTTAVFQVESRGMKELLQKLRPDCFEDLIALVALYRPGPLQSGMVDNFINRKHGREAISYPDPNYQHECLKEILEPTYGIILYQEQVMQIAQALAGYSLGEADLLRRAMGKKKIEEMMKQREFFAAGAEKNGIDKDLALKIFDLVEKFAGYGFNKSHSAAYALISYQTGYLKKYYPAEFMASVMSSVMKDTEKVIPFFKECANVGVEVHTPSINKSNKEFTPDDSGVFYGLAAVKGIGNSYLDKMMADRAEHGPYQSVYEWIYRTSPSKTVIEAAVRCGALDEFGLTRATILDQYVEWQAKAKKDRASGSNQLGFFEDDISVVNLPELPMQRILDGERKSLGVFISGHPLDDNRELVNKLVSSTIREALGDTMVEPGEEDAFNDRPVTVAGYIDDLNIKHSKKGSMAYFQLDDGTAQVRVTMFAEAYHKAQHVIQDDSTVMLKGKLVRDKRTKNLKLLAYNAQSIEMLKDKEISRVVVEMCPDDLHSDAMLKIKEAIQACQEGHTKLMASMGEGEEKKLFELGGREIRPSEDLMILLRNLVGSEKVVSYFRGATDDQGEVQTELHKEGTKTREVRHKAISELFLQAERSMQR